MLVELKRKANSYSVLPQERFEMAQNKFAKCNNNNNSNNNDNNNINNNNNNNK